MTATSLRMHRRFRLALVASTLIAALSCRTVDEPQSALRETVIDACGTPAVLHWYKHTDSAVYAQMVHRLLPESCAVLSARGLLPATLRKIVIHDNAFTFVEATGQDADTLRAWAVPQEIHLIDDGNRFADSVGARLTHELCHVALWHRSGGKKAPRALEEGICSVIAQQASRMDVDDVIQGLDEGRVVDFENDSAFSYGYAHAVLKNLSSCLDTQAMLDVYDRAVAGAHINDALGARPADVVRYGCRALQGQEPARTRSAE